VTSCALLAGPRGEAQTLRKPGEPPEAAAQHSRGIGPAPCSAPRRSEAARPSWRSNDSFTQTRLASACGRFSVALEGPSTKMTARSGPFRSRPNPGQPLAPLQEVPPWRDGPLSCWRSPPCWRAADPHVTLLSSIKSDDRRQRRVSGANRGAVAAPGPATPGVLRHPPAPGCGRRRPPPLPGEQAGGGRPHADAGVPPAGTPRRGQRNWRVGRW